MADEWTEEDLKAGSDLVLKSFGRPDDVYTHWPDPTVPEPSTEELAVQIDEGICDTSDGCRAEPDGECEHGHPSWLLRLGLI